MFAHGSHQRRGAELRTMRDRAHVHRVADYTGADAAECASPGSSASPRAAIPSYRRP